MAKRDEYYLRVAKAVGSDSTCTRRKFGAVIVVNDAIVTTGYNGPVRGGVNCNEVGCAKDVLDLPPYRGYEACPAVHAEENAVINAGASGGKGIFGGNLYIYGEDPQGEPVPSHPCDRCKRVLINARIEEVITMDTEGRIITYEVRDWIKEDTNNYMELLENKKI